MNYKFQHLAAAILLFAASTAYAQVDTAAQTKTELEEVVVVGTDQGRYRTGQKDSLTGFDLDFLELPRIVNTIPEQLVLDQKITDLNEALRNTPGITQGDGFGGTNDDFFIRGFRRNTVYRNGFRRASNFKTNLTNIDFTQVVRGPASITYGQVEPGGLVDIITKKPLQEQRLAGEVRLGSFDDSLVLLDLSQPLSDNAGIRIVASTQDAESFRDFTEIERDAIAISGQFNLSESVVVDLAYEYREENRPLDRGTITVPTPQGREIINNLTDVSIETRFGEENEIFETEFEFFEANINYQINDTWAFRASVAREQSLANDIQARPLLAFVVDADDSLISPNGFFTRVPSLAELFVLSESVFDDPTDRVFLARRIDGSQDQDSEVTYLNAILTGEFNTGSITHKVSIGSDYRDFESTRFFVDNNPAADGVPVIFGGGGPLFNVLDPEFGNLIAALNDDGSLSTDGFSLINVETTDLGFFLNDYIELNDQLSLLLGFRYDEFDFGGDTVIDAESAVSPQLGVNYKINESTSVFASYSEAFEPNIAVNILVGTTEPFEPEESEQFEIGVKAEFFEGKLQTSAALYDIAKSNVLDLVDDLPVLVDAQDSQGFELSVSGQPLPGLNIAAGYSYTDAEIIETRTTPRNVGEDTFNLWTSYELQSGRLEGLGFGGGLFHISDRFGDNANTFGLDSYTLLDASVWYSLRVPGGDGGRTVRFQFAAKNLTDEEFFTASGGPLRISIGTPRTYFGSISFDF